METAEIAVTNPPLVAKNINVAFYYPVVDDKLTIDIKPYYPNLCCFKVIAVECKDSNRSEDVTITGDRTRVRYEFNKSNGYWDDEGAYDIITYVIQDTGTEQTAIGKITLQRIESAGFLAKDVCVMNGGILGNNGLTGPMKIGLDWVNKIEGVEAVEVGTYDRKLIRDITFDPENPAGLIIYPETKCNPWKGGVETEFDYAVRALVHGVYEVSKARVVIKAVDGLFYAQFIGIIVSDPVPATVYIDVKNYNPNFASISLLEVETDTPSERGSVLPDYLSSGVVYNFNTESGYWDSEGANDLLRYRLTNHVTGQEACAYIKIEKEGESTGSGSGSGGGEGTTVYLEDSGAAGNIMGMNSISIVGDHEWEAALLNIGKISLMGIPGVNMLSGGAVTIKMIGSLVANDVGVIEMAPPSSASTLMELNGVARVTDMELYFVVAPGSIPVDGWAVGLRGENPLDPEKQSYISYS